LKQIAPLASLKGYQAAQDPVHLVDTTVSLQD
jgi:hypothetical protein